VAVKGTGKTAAGYIRLSVLTEDTYSPETQRNAILRKCKENGWALKDSNAILDPDEATKIGGGDFYVDLGFSGSKGIHRPAYQALLANLDKYDYVVVYKLDRLTRRVSELGHVLELFDKSNTALVGISDGVDTSTPIGLSVAELLGTIGAAEARNIKDRVKSAQQTMMRAGKWRGGPPPFGYAIKKGKPGEGSTLVIDKEQAKFMRIAVKHFLKGDSIPTICKHLNSLGSRSVKGNPWSDPVLRKLLGHPYLAGYLVYNGEIFRDEKGVEVRPFPPLIELDTYNLLQSKIKERYFYHPSRGGALLSGIVFCVYCGGKMIGASPTEHGGATYRCRGKYQLHTDCEGLSTKSAALEGYVTQVILQMISAKESRKMILGLAKRMKDSEKQTGYDNPVTRHEFLRSELQALQVRKTNGDFRYRGGEEDFRTNWDVLLGRIAETEKEITELKPVTSSPSMNEILSAEDLQSMNEVWKRLTVPQRRDIAKALLRKVVILPTSKDWRFKGYDTDRVVLEWQWQENKTVVSYYARNKVPKAGTRARETAKRKLAKDAIASKTAKATVKKAKGKK